MTEEDTNEIRDKTQEEFVINKETEKDTIDTQEDNTELQDKT